MCLYFRHLFSRWRIFPFELNYKMKKREIYRFNLFHQLRIFEPCTINQLNLEIKYK